MADSKKPDIREGEVTNLPVVQSTTDATPATADESSLPIADDAKTDQPPVRTGQPDVPIAQTLASGAGAHEPPDPKVYGPDGRMLDDPDTLKGR